MDSPNLKHIQQLPTVSVIIVTYNTASLIQQCISSLIEHTKNVTYEIIVVDNASTDNTVDILRSRFPEIICIASKENLGFSRGNNVGATRAKGEYLLFLNADTLFVEDSIKKMVEYLTSYPQVGAIGPKLLFRDDSYQISCGRLPSIMVEAWDKFRYKVSNRFSAVIRPYYKKIHNSVKEMGWLTAAFVLIRKQVFNQVGGFDENLFMYFEDKDLCKRIGEVGLSVVYFPMTSVIHLLGGSTCENSAINTDTIYRKSQMYYYRKHHGKFQNWLLLQYLKHKREK